MSAALVRELYAAFGRRDVEAMKRLLAPEVEWIVPGASALAGTYRGHDQLFAYFGKVATLSGGTYKGELLDVLEGDGRAAALVRSSGRREGRVLDETYVLMIDIADGRIRRARLYPEQGAAFDAFWS